MLQGGKHDPVWVSPALICTGSLSAVELIMGCFSKDCMVAGSQPLIHAVTYLARLQGYAVLAFAARQAFQAGVYA